jgi:hypothetical protein
MSFFSKSSGKRHYARHDYGSDYYKRSHSSHSGILGWILGLLSSSKRGIPQIMIIAENSIIAPVINHGHEALVQG